MRIPRLAPAILGVSLFLWFPFPFGLTSFGSAPEAQADIVRYTDSEGRMHYVDDAGKVPLEYRDQLDDAKELPKITRAENPLFQYPKSSSAALGARKVEIFVTSWCPHCRNLEKTLKEKGVRFTKYDIEKSATGRRKYKEMGGGGVPMSKVGDIVIRGNNPQAIMKALEG